MNSFQKLLGAAFLIIALSIAYYLVIFIPKKNTQQLKQKAQLENQRLINQKDLQNCLDDVNNRFQNAMKTNIDKGNTTSGESFKIFMDFYQKLKDECFKKYPTK
jgi:uncharacterized membrane protein YhiD involved in acid resistance